jgi:ribosomal-protein-alanine N-acetyltransferase
MDIFNIETERLFLRAYDPKTAHYVLKNLPDDEIKKYYGLESFEEVEKEKKKLKRGIKTFNKSFLYFYLIKKGDNKVIGWCGYHTWYTEHDRAELGYVLNHDKYKNKGFLTEAIKPIIDYGFNQMNLSRIEAMVGPKNVPSLKILKKLNFVQEGFLREHYKINNVMEDSLIFSLLKKEYIK